MSTYRLLKEWETVSAWEKKKVEATFTKEFCSGLGDCTNFRQQGLWPLKFR